MAYQPDVLKCYALALDPIHVGTGGMRLGRVDLSIVREPGTNIPKIPGTSLAGAARAYAAMQKNRYRWQANNKTYYVCAGQGQEDKNKNIAGHCGQPDCPICVTFGFSKGSGISFQGLAQFSDARLIFFPVHSLAGPVWVTCPHVLKELGVTETEPAGNQVRVASGVQQSGKLNLGWLMLDVAGNAFSVDGKLSAIPDDIKNRSVLVSDKMFGHIVNDNLEVRTSVSIDPRTGAAAEGALFTYEALPRACVLYFEVVISDPKFYQINGQQPLNTGGKQQVIDTGITDLGKDRRDKLLNTGGKQQVIDTVREGLTLFEFLGVGGMNTRGMGRLRVLNLNAGGT